jgi:hypothetical protein
MMRIVQEHGMGVVAGSFEATELAARLNGLQAEQIHSMKRRSLEAARIFNADAEMGKLLSLYEQLLR